MNCAKIQHSSLASRKAYAGPFRMTTEPKRNGCFSGIFPPERQGIGCWLLAVGYWLLAVGYWLLAVG